jgi:hypothetical protein
MVVTFTIAINFASGKEFHFGSISCIIDWSGALQRIVGTKGEIMRQLATALT